MRIFDFFKRDSKKREVIIPMNAYGDFWNELARSIMSVDKAANTDDIYSKHSAFCANCGVQFSQEALNHLRLYGPGSLLGGRMVITDTSSQGIAMRSGKCPMCGHTKMKIVRLDVPVR